MKYVRQTHIEASPEEVFAFHESPGAIEYLIPPWEKMKVVEASKSLQVGSRVILEGRLLGILPVRWVAEHTEYQPPHLFADRQVSGPFASWHHRHHFLPDGKGGTILRDEVELEPPMGIIGRLLGGWFIRQKLEKMFSWRQDTTRQLILSGAWKNNKQPMP